MKIHEKSTKIYFVKIEIMQKCKTAGDKCANVAAVASVYRSIE